MNERLSTRADGLVTAAELRRRGVHHDAIARLCELGLLRRMRYGIYHDTAVPPHPQIHLAALLLYLDQRRPANHEPALITGMAGLRARGLDVPAPWTTTVLVDPRNRARPRAGDFRVLRSRTPIGEWTRRGSVRLAGVGRCFADAALESGVDDKALRVAADVIRNRQAATMVELRRTWRTVNHRGATRLDRIMATGAFEQESEGERNAWRLLFAGTPIRPDCQVQMTPFYRVDFAVLYAAVILEYYGEDFHAGRVDADASRVHDLERRGSRVIVVTKSMLRDPGPARSFIDTEVTDRARRIATGELRLPVLPHQPPRLTPLRTLRAHPLPAQFRPAA